MAESTSLSKLHDNLDRMWISYLTCLDNYTSSQKLIQEQMSAGFLSLARANFTARGGVRRYGQDFYHERAVATRRVDSYTGNQFEVVRWPRERHVTKHDEASESDEGTSQNNGDEPRQQPSPPETLDSMSLGHDTDSTASQDSKQQSSATPEESTLNSKAPLASDPIRWFGILVPQELRTAQSSFSSVVDDAIVDALNAKLGLQRCECYIRRLRKEIRKKEKATMAAEA